MYKRTYSCIPLQVAWFLSNRARTSWPFWERHSWLKCTPTRKSCVLLFAREIWRTRYKKNLSLKYCWQAISVLNCPFNNFNRNDIHFTDVIVLKILVSVPRFFSACLFSLVSSCSSSLDFQRASAMQQRISKQGRELDKIPVNCYDSTVCLLTPNELNLCKSINTNFSSVTLYRTIEFLYSIAGSIRV